MEREDGVEIIVETMEPFPPAMKWWRKSKIENKELGLQSHSQVKGPHSLTCGEEMSSHTWLSNRNDDTTKTSEEKVSWKLEDAWKWKVDSSKRMRNRAHRTSYPSLSSTLKWTLQSCVHSIQAKLRLTHCIIEFFLLLLLSNDTYK